MGMRTKAATKDPATFFFIGNLWLISDPLITRSPGCSDSFLPSGLTHLATVHCFIVGTRLLAASISFHCHFHLSARDELRRYAWGRERSGSLRRRACPAPKSERSLLLLREPPALPQR